MLCFGVSQEVAELEWKPTLPSIRLQSLDSELASHTFIHSHERRVGHFITSLSEGNYLTSIPSPIGQNMVFLSCKEGRRMKCLTGQVF